MLSLCSEAQVNTQEYGRRPYGVGFLVIGQDQSGPHLYEFSPSGNSYEYFAMSIGARSQSAKTYLEKHYESFTDCMFSFDVLAQKYRLTWRRRFARRINHARLACASRNITAGQGAQYKQHLYRDPGTRQCARNICAQGRGIPDSGRRKLATVPWDHGAKRGTCSSCATTCWRWPRRDRWRC